MPVIIQPRVILRDPDNLSREALVNAEGQLHVVLMGKVDDNNTSQENLDPAEVFQGTGFNTLDYGFIYVTVFSNVASAVNGLQTEISSDGITWRIGDEYSIPAGSEKTYAFQPNKKWFRVKYTNGGTIQGVFDLQTVFKKTSSLPSSHKIQDSIVDEDDAQLVKSVLTGEDEIDQTFENVQTFRQALKVDTALVHKEGVSLALRREVGASTTVAVEAIKGDTSVEVADATGLIVGNQFIFDEGHNSGDIPYTITGVAADVLTLDQPIERTQAIGVAVIEVDLEMSQTVGTLGAPISYKMIPPAGARWQITRLLLFVASAASMDDGKFGGIAALTNGVVVRGVQAGGVMRNGTNWKSNGDIASDMYDVTYTSKAPAGENGLRGRWTFTKAEFVIDLDGDAGEYLEVLIQDDLSANTSFTIKAQGRLFGG